MKFDDCFWLNCQKNPKIYKTYFNILDIFRGKDGFLIKIQNAMFLHFYVKKVIKIHKTAHELFNVIFYWLDFW